MWRRIADWYWGWEDEMIAVLERPELAATLPAGYRRYMGVKLAALSPIERRQLRDFTLAYRGAPTWRFLARLFVLFCLCGALLHLAVPRIPWFPAIGVANLIGFGMALGICGVWFNYRLIARMKWGLLGKTMVGALGGALLASVVLHVAKGRPVATLLDEVPFIAGIGLGAGLLGTLPMLVVALLRNRQYEALAAQLQQEAERERLARELSESQLRLLRAQIEPHFLFNTLGAVQQLAQHGAPRAAALTADLIAFLRASLGDMRCDQVTLEAEFGLVASYLKVMQARLGERLRVRIDLPRALADVRVPSMILLTLAENAIKHGIEPALRGGEIVVAASVADGEGVLRLRVQDSGVGMSAVPGAGLGLDNVRHRLRLAYGEAASLALRDADPGLVADVAIPWPAAQPEVWSAARSEAQP
ncbi:sensor histidine kinase [uncultured Massilia sp.]|uniref:sensor histidine kinase n=1 Tax=uncultured Massilia sp. TaxID=169973 RepID=UPI0025CBB7D1|nr:histidine kinase [uncultured Massilia sp.]